MTFNPLRWNRDVQNLIGAISKYGIALVFASVFYVDFVRPLATTMPKHGEELVEALRGIGGKVDNTTREISELRAAIVGGSEINREHFRLTNTIGNDVKEIVKTLDGIQAEKQLEN